MLSMLVVEGLKPLTAAPLSLASLREVLTVPERVGVRVRVRIRVRVG